MKKRLCLLLALCMIFTLAACAGNSPAQEPEKPQDDAAGTAETTPEAAADWTREGFFQGEEGRMMTITWMGDIDEPGWYVAYVDGEDWVEDAWCGILPQDGAALRGELPSSGSKEPMNVTVSEEGDGILFEIEGGETLHFAPMEIEEATIFVRINVDGFGNIDYAEGDTAPEIDRDYPYQSAQINLAAPKVHTLVAWANAGNRFVKWTKNGEDISDEPQITVNLDESAEYVAVFEEDPDWQNPVMNFIGEYQCDRAHALVECFGYDSALVTIDWGGSASETAQWIIIGWFDTETLTVEYTDATKSVLTYSETGELTGSSPVYMDGTGTIVFSTDGSFTWHEDQSEYGTDMVFEWIGTSGAEG